MKLGFLSEYFSGVAAKELSAVEANPVRSNQHELNGVESLKTIFGRATEKQRFDAKFIYLCDYEDEPIISEGFVTWYDARKNHPTRSEHRMYFSTTEVSARAAEGDVLVIARQQDGKVLFVFAEAGSTVSNQIHWLFGFPNNAHAGFSVKAEDDSDKVKLEFASRLILEEIGIEQSQLQAPNFLDLMLDKFGKKFPATRVFSQFARGTLDLDPREDPDAVLLAWMEREEMLFRTLERHIIEERLQLGFNGDVDGFIAFSLSVQNRRKSRVGSAFENHIEEVFIHHEIGYDRTKVTENKSKPDFIFPDIIKYRDPDFPTSRLTMLGVKSTCKDRWRQVLAEANRIDEKHLLTLEPGISTNQTDEMRDKGLSLVLPSSLHSSYTPLQRNWLTSIGSFIEVVKERQ
ncbi:Type-2 restriction enzyme EcoRII [Burkholderia lata]|uniref:type II restriction endonuclease n=1 Tax=Burkholderia TaxID=32008 RepID=UPI0014533525|nr:MULTISPECIES: type II restriction endonuclease [Burkholderia]MCA8299734.1 restriction endonuclease [Burkholderia sp. AU30198]VWC13647.1 Type-2 restriction enzyme EcoRII [Burkholderia lata]